MFLKNLMFVSLKNLNQFKDKILKHNNFKFINIKNREKFIKNFLNHNSNPLKDYFREIDKLINLKN